MSHLLRKHRWLHVLAVLVAVVGQLVSMVPAVQAEPGEPGPYGRPLNYGYFFGRFDGGGDDVLPGGLFVNNVDSFIVAIRSRAQNWGGGWPLQHIRGAQFIIQTMRGGGFVFPSNADIDDWERRVRYVASYGGINFDAPISFSINSYYQDAHGDDAYYTKSHGSFIWHPWTFDAGAIVGNSIAFYAPDGSFLYGIRKACANPVGSPTPLPFGWQFSGESYIDGNDQASGGAFVTGRKLIRSIPGSTVTFSHFIRQSGPATATTRYHAWMHFPGNPAWFTVSNDLALPNPGNITLGPGGNAQVVRDAFTVPINANPGDVYCQHVGYQPSSFDNAGPSDRLDLQACVEVAYSYNLVPSAQASQTTGAVTDAINMTYTVNNSGITRSRPTNWAVRELVVDPGVSIDLASPYTDNASCATFVKPGVTCTDAYVSPTPIVFNQGVTSIPPNPASTFTIGNYRAGTKVCRVLAIDPPTQDSSPSRRWSRPSCVIVGKRPTVHFMGGDISVGGAYPNSSGICSVGANSGNIFTAANTDANGSVVEYAAVARGAVHLFGSASKPDTSAQHFLATALTFANVPLGEIGNFGDNPHCMTDYYAKFAPQIPSSPTPGGGQDVGALASGGTTTQLHYGGNLTISRSTIPKAAQLLIVVDGDVTITDDITYDSPYGSLNDIPSFALLVRGNITINSNVRQLDGAYITRGNLATCEIPGSLTADICNNQLVVNGFVMADTVALRRTAGADATEASDPAERFFYGSELFFKNVLAGTDSQNTINTIEERDLPPHY